MTTKGFVGMADRMRFISFLSLVSILFSFPLVAQEKESSKQKTGSAASDVEKKGAKAKAVIRDSGKLKVDESLMEVIRDYKDQLKKNPKDPEAWNGVGICLVHLERPDEAKKAFRKAVQADAFFAKTHINLGNLYFKQQDWDRAIDEYRLATSIDSTDTKAWLNLGLAYERVNNVNRAILAYDKAAECDDSDPSPWERLGWIYYEHKMYAAARDRWTEAIKRDPSRTDLADNVRRLQDYADSVGAK